MKSFNEQKNKFADLLILMPKVHVFTLCSFKFLLGKIITATPLPPPHSFDSCSSTCQTSLFWDADESAIRLSLVFA
jgi:hypothetical protein